MKEKVRNFFAKNLIECLLSLLLSFKGLILLSDVFVVKFIRKELEWMIVVADQFVISVDLIGKSSFLD
jgi:hypothetical protein